MSTSTEELIQREMELNKAREQAALRQHGTLIKAAKVCRIVGWVSPIIPIVGLFGLMFLGFLFPMIAFAIAFVAGAKATGLKQIVITLLGTVGVGIGWAILYAIGMLSLGIS